MGLTGPNECPHKHTDTPTHAFSEPATKPSPILASDANTHPTPDTLSFPVAHSIAKPKAFFSPHPQSLECPYSSAYATSVTTTNACTKLQTEPSAQPNTHTVAEH